MGLKKNYYEVKEFGVVLPTAYAVVKSLSVYEDRIFATIAIQKDRESAFNLSPYKTIDVEIHDVDRKRNPYEVVYEYVTGEDVFFDKRLQREIRIPRVLHGWENDIVSGV